MPCFILVCLIILCGFAAAFAPKQKIKLNKILLITVLCLPLGIMLIITQNFK